MFLRPGSAPGTAARLFAHVGVVGSQLFGWDRCCGRWFPRPSPSQCEFRSSQRERYNKKSSLPRRRSLAWSGCAADGSEAILAITICLQSTGRCRNLPRRDELFAFEKTFCLLMDLKR